MPGFKVSGSVRLQDGTAAQWLVPTGTRINATAASTASAAAALPAGADTVAYVRATDFIWFNSGGDSVAAAANNTSVLVGPGENLVRLADGATHFSVLRVGSADVGVQVESIAATATS